jgi:hypothetical protein
MAREVMIEGERYRVRSPWAVLGLGIVTLGIYYLWWYYRINDDARRYLRDYELRPFVSFLAITVGWMILVPPFVSYLRTGERIRQMQERAGAGDDHGPGLGLALFILVNLLGGVYAQYGLNRVWSSPTADTTLPVAAPPRPRARNQVTPGDVGSRVSFQFELPNGFTTEAVGVFERWDAAAETYFVRKKDGTEVRVPARGVRFGKVIPPMPAAPGR